MRYDCKGFWNCDLRCDIEADRRSDGSGHHLSSCGGGPNIIRIAQIDAKGARASSS